MAETSTNETPCPRPWRWGHLILLLAVALSWLGLTALNAWFGELNQDEGWYLNAAKLLTEGRVPYRDFAFTQAPMLPLVYSWMFNWVGHYGLLGGRVVTALLGALGTLLAVWLAMRTGPRQVQRLTGGLCLILIALNVYQSYFTTVVKTYALGGMFLAGGLAMLSFVGRTKGLRASMASGFLLACATATRISLGAALALGGMYLLLCQRRLKAWVWLDYAIGGALGLALTLLPFWMLGRDGFIFGVVQYHTLREVGPLAMQVAFKLGCLARLAQAYFPAAILGVFLLIMAGRRVVRWCRPAATETAPAAVEPEPAPEDIPPCFASFLWVTVLVLALVHLAAPFPYDDYQTPVYPIYCAVLAATGARWWLRVETRWFNNGSVEMRSARRLGILTVIWLICGLHSFASPVAQNWFVAGRDRIWWRLREQSPVAQLRDMAKWVNDLTEAAQGTELLTQDVYLAVEANLPVPHGLEMGPFSYYPDWPRERAERIGVMNRDMLRELLATTTEAPIAALSGYSLAIRSPQVDAISREDDLAFQRILRERFEPVDSMPNFGQAATTLEIWRLKQPELEEGALSPAAEEE